MYIDAIEETQRARAPERLEEEQWFKNLYRDLHIMMPKDTAGPAEDELPSIHELYQFVEGLVENATDLMRRDAAKGRMTEAAAWAIQRACIAMLIVGYEFPPCRLQYIKSAMHPDYVTAGCCEKRSCSSPNTCMGNRFELTMKDGCQRVRFIMPHHKNTTKGSKTILFMIPTGSLTDLLLAHINGGRQKLMASRDDVSSMFVSHGRQRFSDQTLSRYFKNRILQDAPFATFTPMLARRIFVEAYCGACGPEPEMWDGASVVSHASHGSAVEALG